MKGFLKVFSVVFGAVTLIFLLIWGVTGFGEFGWHTILFAFFLGMTILSIILLILPGDRGLPLEHLKTGLYPKSSIVGELKGKGSPEKEGESLLFVGSKRSSVPRYARMPKSDFVKIDPEGNTLKVLKKSSHTMEGRRVNVRQLIFFKQGK